MVLGAPLLAAFLALGATTAQYLHRPAPGLGEAFAEEQGFITREWTWPSGTTTTTFTAYGPADQVNHLDPQDPALQCPDCELASSTHFEPGDVAEPVSPR